MENLMEEKKRRGRPAKEQAAVAEQPIQEAPAEEPTGVVEVQNTNFIEPVGSNSNTYRFLGSYNQEGKLSSEIEMGNEYFVKLLYMGSDCSCKVGYVFETAKKRAIKELRGELTQMTIEDLDQEFGPKVDYTIAYDQGVFTMPNNFFDEIHAYSNNYKYSYIEYMHMPAQCCPRKGHLVLDGKKRLLCSKCGNAKPNTGTFKPKSAINF